MQIKEIPAYSLSFDTYIQPIASRTRLENMKTKLYLSWLLFFCTGVVSAQSHTDILAIAQAGFRGYLEQIPPGQEPRYGFENREEIGKARLGKPYQVVTLTNEFLSDTEIIPGKNYLVPAGEWRVAVMVDNEPRVLVTLAEMDGKWEVVGMGAAALAKDIGKLEQVHASSELWGQILRVYPLKSDYLITTPDASSGQIQVCPLMHSYNALNQSAVYPLQPFYSLLRSAISNH